MTVAAVRALLVAGPPFGSQLWDEFARRLRGAGWVVDTHDLLGGGQRVGAQAAVAGLAEALDPNTLLVAQGSALPVALAAAARNPPAGLVLCNGDIDGPHLAGRVWSGLSRIPVLGGGLWWPPLATRLLASSVGLRRLVVNPYVMERDTVVAITAEALGERVRRRAARAYRVEVAEMGRERPPNDLPKVLLWGDEDPLCGPDLAEAACVELGNCRHIRIPGGQHLHVVERPWAGADALRDWWAVERRAPRSTTP
jgi:hypothetical protein